MPPAAAPELNSRVEPLREPRAIQPPKLIIEWEPWPRQAWRRFTEQFRRKPAPLLLTSRPAMFWPDVFVPERKSGGGLAISALYHAAALGFMYLVPTLILLSKSTPHIQQELANASITYYKVSEYLPEIRSQSSPARIARKAEPRLAPQRVISVPLRPDNREQTILNPPNVRLLPQHVALPNVVVSTPILASPQAIPGAAPKLVFPFAPPQVVAPAVQVNAAQIARIKVPNLSAPSVIQPPVSVELKPTKLGQINIASAEVEAPKMPEPQQQASGSTETNDAAKTAAAAVPPAPAITGGDSSRVAGQLLAIGLNPASVEGPIPVPNGNRHGEFAAGPEGKPDAPGAPELKAGGTAERGAGTGTREGAGNSNGAALADAPGISVAPPPNRTPAAIAGEGAIAQAPPKPKPANSEPREIAKLEPPRPLSDSPEPVDAVFSGKKFYSLTLNMPNLTSAGGSWIIRFAQLGDNVPQGELTAPVALEKVDPAYPPDLIADRIEGTVTLYAVIRSDGTVSEVRVLRHLEERLDQNAIRALERWRFRPATRNGLPVDLEAVVQIPFKLRRSSF